MARLMTESEIRHFIHHQIDEMSGFILQYWGVDLSTLQLKVSFDRRLRKSQGGIERCRNGVILPAMNLAVARYALGYTDYREYDFIKDDPVIGSLGAQHGPQRALMALVTHEVSHVIEYALHYIRGIQDADRRLYCLQQCGELFEDQSEDCIINGEEPKPKTHGVVWRQIYRVLRDRYVNRYEDIDIDPEWR